MEIADLLADDRFGFWRRDPMSVFGLLVAGFDFAPHGSPVRKLVVWIVRGVRWRQHIVGGFRQQQHVVRIGPGSAAMLTYELDVLLALKSVLL